MTSDHNAPAGAPAARILVVDDSEMNRDLLSRRLEKQGYRVGLANDGAAALARLAEEAYDLVLLDIMMPGIDGYEVLGRIKADAALSHLPVVMISALGESESVVRCLDLGAEDYLPKPFNPAILKARVEASLNKKRLHDRERLYAEAMERELEIGRRIQQGFLPEALPEPPGYEIAAHFAPARQVAGDFYDAFTLDSGRIALILADVCDKGVGAALYMALFRSLLRAAATHPLSSALAPEALLKASMGFTNDYIAETHERANMFATVFFALLEPETARLCYINAGHEPALVLRRGEVALHLATTGPAAGLSPGVPFAVGEAYLEPCDLLLAYTDGLTEAEGPEGFFGEDRLHRLLGAHQATAPAALLAALAEAVARHGDGLERSDDLTLLAVRRAAGIQL